MPSRFSSPVYFPGLIFVRAEPRLFHRQRIDSYPISEDGYQIGARRTDQGILLNSLDLSREKISLGVLPTPDDVRDAINSLVGDARRKVLRHHTFWKERSLRKGLESLVYAGHRAYMDICRHDTALGALADSRDFQDQIDHAVGHAAQKDVVAYCALAQGVRDTLANIRELRSDIADDISEIENRMFRMDISQFIRELRNNVLHGRVLVPQWSVSFLHGSQTRTGSMRYSKEELRETGYWKAQSLRFIRSSSDEHLRLTVVVQEHFALLNDLRSKLEDLFARNTLPAERDYWNIEDAHKRGLRRQWAKILVGQVGKGKDPFDPQRSTHLLCEESLLVN